MKKRLLTLILSIIKNLLLILLATLFVACNEGARHDDGSLKYITVDFSKESSIERFAVNKMGRYSFPVNGAPEQLATTKILNTFAYDPITMRCYSWQ